MDDAVSKAKLRVTRLLSAMLFLGSIIALFAVGERAVSAIHQWHKFTGYDTPGVITLSLETGLLFTLVASLLCVVSSITFRVCRRHSEYFSAGLAKFATTLYIVAVASYWVIALSPLNEWRS